MYFELPGSGVLQKAFVGARAFHERGQEAPNIGLPRGTKAGILIDHADKTFDGFTLITTTRACYAEVVDMGGNVVHSWSMPFSQAWPAPEHVKNPLGDDRIHWFRCHPFPNGDLLAVFQTEGDTPCGYGLVKLDKDSKLLWTYSGRVHHNVDVGADGTIYTLTSQNMTTPPTGLEFIPTPFVADFLVVLSPQGKEVKKVGVLEAFRDSDFALTLAVIEDFAKPRPSQAAPPLLPVAKGVRPVNEAKDAGPINAAALAKDGPPGRPKGARQPVFGLSQPFQGDIIHANSIRVLNPSTAAKFPMFQTGQVLISLRALDAIAMVDLQKATVTWSAHGIWSGQHDPEFLDNGRLLIYDNYGATKGTRILEYDPRTGAIPWCYANENSHAFVAKSRGHAQRLGNGNTLFVDPEGGRVLEVTPAKEIVWELGYTLGDRAVSRIVITSARRCRAEELSFLKGNIRARP